MCLLTGGLETSYYHGGYDLLKLRLAKDSDRTRCLELLKTLGGYALPGAAKIFDQLLTEQRGALLVAEHQETVIGMVSVSFNLAMRYEGEYCQVEELIVDPSARGLKVGGALVQAAVDLARKRGCKEAGLYLLPSTEHNQPFYEKYGFEKVGSEMRQILSNGS